MRRLAAALLALATSNLAGANAGAAGGGGAGGEPIRVAVDLRDATRRIYHAHESIPVEPGPVALRLAKWIPGEHSPTGPIGDAVGFRFQASGRSLAWARDPIDPFVIRVDVPAGVRRLEVELDHLVPSAGDGFTASPSASDRLAVLSWNELVLYPAEADPATLEIEPSLTLPDGWQAASALRVLAAKDRSKREADGDASGQTLRYAAVSLETLIDSPVATGANHRVLELAAPKGAPAHALHLFADSLEALQPEPAVLAPLEAHLVPETLALFGAHHYDRYDFLFTLSDHVGHFGLEHHASSDDRLPERTLLEPSTWLVGAGLLPHEFVHSWNAKYRRPKGLATGDYHTPMVGDLLWVYEGLTSYLGDVLTARAGLVDLEQARESLALQAAGLAATKGRTWRPLLDTARDAQHTYAARDEGASWRRGVDFYDEGVMLWLEVDAWIREETKGARSLDDFCRAFFGPPSGPAEVRPYDRAELVAALNAVAPRDWEAFFHARVDALRPDPPVEGLEAAGWKLVYSAKANDFSEAYAEEEDAPLDVRFSLGLVLSSEGLVVDVVPGSPAEAARIGVGATLVAVDSRAFTPTVLGAAIKAANAGDGRLEFLVRNADYYSTHVVTYRDGPRFPHLVRLDAKPDWLSAILKPKSWTPPPKDTKNEKDDERRR